MSKDVRAGLVSREAAAERYGVELSQDSEVDLAATDARRAELRKQAGDEQFDFGPLPPIDDLRAQIASERRDFDADRAAREEIDR